MYSFIGVGDEDVLDDNDEDALKSCIEEGVEVEELKGCFEDELDDNDEDKFKACIEEGVEDKELKGCFEDELDDNEEDDRFELYVGKNGFNKP